MIQIHMQDLSETIANDLSYFCNKFVEIGFVRRTVPSEIRGMYGVGNREKAERVIDGLLANLRLTVDKAKWFEDFLLVFTVQPAYAPLAKKMKTAYAAA